MKNVCYSLMAPNTYLEKMKIIRGKESLSESVSERETGQ
jgi:hypothetical protein